MNFIEEKDLCFVSGGVKDNKSVQDIEQEIMNDLGKPFKTDQDGIA